MLPNNGVIWPGLMYTKMIIVTVFSSIQKNIWLKERRGALFLIKGNEIRTPALDQGCRKSVYRYQLLTVLSKSEEFEITEEAISPFSIQKADELFVLVDAKGVYSIAQYRKKKFQVTQTEKIWAMFLEHITTQNQL